MIRQFFCNDCKHIWEREFESIHTKYKKTKCPSCHSKSTGQQFSTMTQYNCIDASSHMTAEKASDINKKFYGREYVESMMEKDPVGRARKARMETQLDFGENE